jgi:hypothetical protein
LEEGEGAEGEGLEGLLDLGHWICDG